MTRIAVFGTTGWGTTLAALLAGKGLRVSLWARTEEEAKELSNARQNVAFLPGVVFPEGLSVTSSVERALRGAALVILAVPSQRMRANVRLLNGYLSESTLILSAAKGLELGTMKRMSCVIADELDSPFHRNICVLSGPNLSKEVVASTRSVAEGIDTTKAALQMAKALAVEMAITERTYKVLFEGLDLRQALAELMGREAKPEMAVIGGTR